MVGFISGTGGCEAGRTLHFPPVAKALRRGGTDQPASASNLKKNPGVVRSVAFSLVAHSRECATRENDQGCGCAWTMCMESSTGSVALPAGANAEAGAGSGQPGAWARGLRQFEPVEALDMAKRVHDTPSRGRGPRRRSGGGRVERLRPGPRLHNPSGSGIWAERLLLLWTGQLSPIGCTAARAHARRSGSGHGQRGARETKPVSPGASGQWSVVSEVVQRDALAGGAGVARPIGFQIQSLEGTSRLAGCKRARVGRFPSVGTTVRQG